MNKTKFLHIGDIHFDSKLIGLDDKKRDIRHYETFETLKRVLNENADAKFILFSGDIFDGAYSKLTVTKLCQLFGEHTEKQFFISCGNHDYLLCENTKILTSSLPQNAHIFNDTITSYEYREYGIRIYGCSFSSPYEHSSLFTGFKAKEDDLVNIMIMHGDIESDSVYNSIKLCDVDKSNLDYLALGHKHSFSGIKQIGKTLYAYPGILEPRGFDECGICGIIKGEVSDNRVVAEFLPVNARCYENIEVDITGISNEEELVRKISRLLDKNNLYRISLVGTRCDVLSLNIGLLENIINVFYCEIFDNTTSDIDIFSYLGENTLRGKTAEILDEYIHENRFDDPLLKKDVIEVLTRLLCKGGYD